LADFEARERLARDGQWTALVDLVRAQARMLREHREVRSATRLSHAGSLPPENPAIARATTLMEDGLVRKAIQTLVTVDDGRASAPPDALARLSELFVLIPEPLRGAVDAPHAPVTTHSEVRTALTAPRENHPRVPWTAVVVKGLSALGRGTAAGPCGLRRDVLHPLVSSSDRLADALAELTDHVLAGRVADAYLTRNVLSLIAKPRGGVRPIGVGTILRRLAGRLAAQAVTPLLRPFTDARGQLGLSEMGTTRLFRFVQNAAAARQTILALDIENAFNTVSRTAIRAAIEKHGGPAKAFCRVLYDSPCQTLVRAPRIAPSEEPVHVDDALERFESLSRSEYYRFYAQDGVVQGCPLAPLLFATIAAEQLEALRAAHPTVCFAAFHDDTFLSCPDPEALTAAFVATRSQFASVGLRFSASKCKILMPAPHSAPSVLSACASETASLTCMGGPVVGADHPNRDALVYAGWKEKADKVRATVHSLRHLPHPQHIVTALQLAGSWSRVNYYASLDETHGFPMELLRDLETEDAAMLSVALRQCGPMMNPLDWVRATLPTAMGGLGIKSVTAEAIARRPTFGQYVQHLMSSSPDLSAARAAPDAAARDMHDVTRTLLQRALPADRAARFAELGGPRANGWLTITARTADATRINSPAVAAACIALAGGMAVLPADLPLCPGAYGGCYHKVGDARERLALDRFGHHAAACPAVRRMLRSFVCA
jgi:hypothetical protein